MRRFVLRQNVIRFQQALEMERDEALCRSIRDMLATSRRELALLEAGELGAQVAPLRSPARRAWREHEVAESFRDDFDFSGLAIVDINDAHRNTTHTSRDVIGRALFDAFPDDPAHPGSEDVYNFYAMICAAADSGQRQTMAAHRYDVRSPDGLFLERYWRSETTPILNEEGRLLFLLHKGEDVTAAVIDR